MTRYFGVKCPTCNADVPLAECKPMEGTKITFYVVPAEPVSCRACGSSHSYTPVDSTYFDGPDGLIARRHGDRGALGTLVGPSTQVTGNPAYQSLGSRRR